MVVGSWWVVAEEGEGEDAKQCLIKQKEKEKKKQRPLGDKWMPKEKRKKDESQKSNKGTKKSKAKRTKMK